MSVDGFAAAGDEDQAPLFDQRMFFAEQPANPSALKKPPKFLGTQSDAESHFRGHRERLRSRFRDSGETALADYGVLELLLFRLIIPRPRYQADCQGSYRSLWDAGRRDRRPDRFAAGAPAKRSRSI
jgi:hypothetical protein